MIADGEVKAVTSDRRDDLLEEQSKQNGADGREVEVVNFEQEVELESLAAPHQFPSSEDYNVVGYKDRRARLDVGDGRLAGHEAEVLRLVSDGGLEDFFEDGP